MTKIGLFYGTDTGNTEIASRIIQKEFPEGIIELHDIARSKKEEIEEYSYLIFGTPTWYYGEPQCDWDDFFPTLEEIDFTGKTIAIFGLGDQEDYGDYFCDSMKIIADIVIKNGGKIIGHWSSDSYKFHQSQASLDKDTLVGLCLDEDRQPELTRERIHNWAKQITKEFNLC